MLASADCDGQDASAVSGIPDQYSMYCAADRVFANGCLIVRSYDTQNVCIHTVSVARLNGKNGRQTSAQDLAGKLRTKMAIDRTIHGSL